MINKKNKYKKNYSNRRIKNKLYNLKRNTKNSIITWSNILFLYLHISLSEAYLWLNLYLDLEADTVPFYN